MSPQWSGEVWGANHPRGRRRIRPLRSCSRWRSPSEVTSWVCLAFLCSFMKKAYRSCSPGDSKNSSVFLQQKTELNQQQQIHKLYCEGGFLKSACVWRCSVWALMSQTVGLIYLNTHCLTHSSQQHFTFLIKREIIYSSVSCVRAL